MIITAKDPSNLLLGVDFVEEDCLEDVGINPVDVINRLEVVTPTE